MFPLRLLLAFALISWGGWIRPEYEDAFVIARSELVVIGHLKEGSIRPSPHLQKEKDAVSNEHEGVLMITSVIKGGLGAVEIPIILHYGLTPVERERDHGGNRKVRGIEIWDTGNSAVSFAPFIKDAREDHLWFLRRRGGINGREAGAEHFGVVDPEDIRDSSLKDYFLAYFSEDPEDKLKKLTADSPDLAKRAKRYLAIDLDTALTYPDPVAQTEGLLLYLTRMHRRRGNEQFKEDLSRASENIAKLFEDPNIVELRGDIINVWATIRYEPAVEVLIGLLAKLDLYWASQTLQDDKVEKYAQLSKKQQRAYAEMTHALSALRRIQDPRARPAIMETRKRWSTFGGLGVRVLEECDAALEKLPNK